MTAARSLVQRALVAVAVALFALAVPGEAEPPDAAGWWWKAQATPLVAVPKPPTVPDGGLYVAGDPSGPFGYSALRLFIPADATVGQMVLRVASAQGTIAVRACVTSIAWGPEQGGQISGAPAYDCGSGTAPGLFDAASNTVAFEVSPLVRDGFLNVVVVPNEGAVFQAAFEKPGDDAVTVTAGSSGFADSGSEFEEDTSFLEGPAFTDVPASDGGVGSGDFLSDPVLPDVVAPPTTAAPSARPGAGTGIRPLLRPLPVSKKSKGGVDRDSLIASFVFTGLLGLWILLLQAPTRAPKLVGRFAGTATHAESVVAARGVGRFRRPRSGAAPRL